MSEKIILVIMLLFFIGCTEQKEIKVTTNDNQVSTNMWIQECGGCEYVVYQNCIRGMHESSIAVAMVHKQNCKYCIQRSKEK